VRVRACVFLRYRYQEIMFIFIRHVLLLLLLHLNCACVVLCQQPYLFEEIVLAISRHARETVVACGPREGLLFNNPSHQILYHNTIKTLFISFARCLQQLAFSGCEEAMDNDETSVSQLIGSPSGYKNKTNKHQGPVSNKFDLAFTAYTIIVLLFSTKYIL